MFTMKLPVCEDVLGNSSQTMTPIVPRNEQASQKDFFVKFVREIHVSSVVVEKPLAASTFVSMRCPQHFCLLLPGTGWPDTPVILLKPLSHIYILSSVTLCCVVASEARFTTVQL